MNLTNRKCFKIMSLITIWIILSMCPTLSCGKKPIFCNPDCGRGETSSEAKDLESCNCIFYQYEGGKLTKKNLVKSSCKLVTDRKDPCYKLCKKEGGRNYKGSLCIDRCFCVPSASSNRKTPRKS